MYLIFCAVIWRGKKYIPTDYTKIFLWNEVCVSVNMYFACFYVLKGKDKFSVHLKKCSVQTCNLSTLEAGGGGLTLALATH